MEQNKLVEYVKISLDRYDEFKTKENETNENEVTVIKLKDLFKGDGNFFNTKYTVKDKSNFIEDVADILNIDLGE